MGLDALTNQLDSAKLIQLAIIIGGYLFFRSQVTSYMKNQTLRAQLSQNNDKEQAEKLIDRPEDLPQDPISVSDRSWGWGKPTRRRVLRQKKLLEEKLEEAARKIKEGEEPSDDEDIADLIED